MRVKLALLLSIAVVLALMLGFASLSLKLACRTELRSTLSPEHSNARWEAREAVERRAAFLVVPLLGVISLSLLATMICAVLAVVLFAVLRRYEAREKVLLIR